MTEQEIREIKDAILRSAVKVEDMPVTDSLEGVTTLPCIMGNEYVRVPLPAVRGQKFYPLRAMPVESESGRGIALRGDIAAMQAEGLVPVLFRRVPAVLAFRSGGELNWSSRQTCWKRFTDIPGVCRVRMNHDYGLLEIMRLTAVSVPPKDPSMEPGSKYVGSKEYTSLVDGFVFPSLKHPDVYVRNGSRRKKLRNGATLTYGVAFFEPDHIRNYRLDWSKQRSEMAVFRVLYHVEKNQSAQWIFACSRE